MSSWVCTYHHLQGLLTSHPRVVCGHLSQRLLQRLYQQHHRAQHGDDTKHQTAVEPGSDNVDKTEQIVSSGGIRAVLCEPINVTNVSEKQNKILLQEQRRKTADGKATVWSLINACIYIYGYDQSNNANTLWLWYLYWFQSIIYINKLFILRQIVIILYNGYENTSEEW